MDWNKMKLIEPELSRLESSSENAGKHNATWLATLAATHEALSKAVGRGAQREELQTAEAYECARAALFAAWSKGSKQGEPVDVQATFLDTSQQYT